MLDVDVPYYRFRLYNPLYRTVKSFYFMIMVRVTVNCVPYLAVNYNYTAVNRYGMVCSPTVNA